MLKGIGKFIPSYRGHTIFTRFYWRTLKDRLFKGFDETCTWSLNYSLSKLIEPRLTLFAKHTRYMPQSYIKAVEKELSTKNRKRIFAEAERRWNNDIDIMRHAFADIIEEEDNWENWINKYKPLVDKYNKKLNRLKTEEAKKKYWESFKITRKYKKGNEFNATDFSDKLRRHGLELFSKHFEELWW